MNRQEIVKFYENKIDDIKEETKKEELLDKLEKLEDILRDLDFDIDEEIEKQESDYLPSQNEMWHEFETERKGIMLC